MVWLEGKKARDEMIDTITKILDESIVKCLCGMILDAPSLMTSKIGNEYWVFCRCRKCNFDFNHEKIIRQYRAIKGVVYN